MTSPSDAHPNPTSLPQAALSNWTQFAARRQDVAATLAQIADCLRAAEASDDQRSGQLGLSGPIHEVQQAADSIRQGTYRLMVMGDMKRGKSTLLNALLGENLLPSDVNPCTALLTCLRYGPEKRVTLHFKDERSPQTIALETFRQSYTIDPTESKRLEASGADAFPNIAQVVVEYPLPLLQPGIELIDTPGLNDTEARNEQVLSYLTDCQAVLFVLSATQPLTLDEQRYLNNYLKSSGLALFFVINGWDRIEASLVDPDDDEAVATAEANVKQVFSRNLADYTAEEPRIFTISALKALRQRLKQQPLQGSGVGELLSGLDQFLAYERGPAELQRALSVAQRASRSVSASVARRIPLLGESLEELEVKVASVQSDFGKLEEIRDRYRQLIVNSSNLHAQSISDSFKAYILGLEDTFESDFADSQPNLEFLEFLEADKRQAFYRSFKRAFERYINDRLAAWEFTAKQTIGTAFDQLNTDAADYQVAYAEVIEVIHEKMMGNRFYAVGQNFDPSRTKIWADSVRDIFEDIPANMNNTIRGFNYFWQSVLKTALIYVCASVALQLLGLLFSSLFLNIVGVVMAAGGIFAVQAELVRQEFLKATRQEFAKYLPKIANEQAPHIHRAVKSCFQAYEDRAIDRITGDIDARKVELTSLVAQKQQREIDREQEITRLQDLANQVEERVAAIESLAPPLVNSSDSARSSAAAS